MKLAVLLVAFLCAFTSDVQAQSVPTSTVVDAAVIDAAVVDAAVVVDAVVVTPDAGEIAAVVTSTTGPSLLFQTNGAVASIIGFLLVTILGLIWKLYSKKPFPVQIVNAAKAPEAPADKASGEDKQA